MQDFEEGKKFDWSKLKTDENRHSKIVLCRKLHFGKYLFYADESVMLAYAWNLVFICKGLIQVITCTGVLLK